MTNDLSQGLPQAGPITPEVFGLSINGWQQRLSARFYPVSSADVNESGKIGALRGIAKLSYRTVMAIAELELRLSMDYCHRNFSFELG